ncbi:MAG: hypothetical protein A2268_15105 [Candidatus Raymondbacteria bacterium RifOxyA12_full_50_37]|nr:MAG: hypothetical protein A2268_15105 [Candidatus Raymondbacteria bacterium RifOxyA12_full_50_37]OGJ88513.1 MAG: hypothetical protein A2248_20155 [Candidatus Raymondbacteria bacterium RIFOXYA2_FULL_49_16]OGJ98974.1 MAG: hypothetical protein A2453_10875 [Candidatus Raymondbacteria bacterium RIFOXYC2_FULL_50_21]OGK00612.1 MAG: hypothetical protein A2487_13720 [Candidatus Raymondbacteria bacterium RifOxyC12_full_50_8]OGP41484.1 MAG: hypothetical protein A2324_05685 [Candidatus Raymondbacteria b
MNLFKAIVIGCGRIGAGAAGGSMQSHAEAYSKHPGITLSGLCDADPGRLLEAAGRFKVKSDSDYIRLCTEIKPDIVSICTPDNTHDEIACSLLESVSPRLIFMEKPVALTADAGAKMLALAQSKKCLIAVNYTRRYSEAFQKVRDNISAGLYGNPLQATMTYGKGLFHNGTHAIDLLRYWFGDFSSEKPFEKIWGPAADASYSCVLTFQTGFKAVLRAFDERVSTVFEGDYIFEKGRVGFTNGGALWHFYDNTESPYFRDYRNYIEKNTQATCFAQPFENCLYRAIDNIVAALNTSAPLLCDGQDGLMAIRIAERIRNDYEAHSSCCR